jgi:hypothetical protein
VPAATEAFVTRVRERLAKLEGLPEIEPQRIAQELVTLAERGDITEELVRLDHHLQALTATLKAPGAIGKRVEFLLQEIQRELNTTGSKAADLTINGLVVEGRPRWKSSASKCRTSSDADHDLGPSRQREDDRRAPRRRGAPARARLRRQHLPPAGRGGRAHAAGVRPARGDRSTIDQQLDDRMRERARAGNAVLEGRLAAVMAGEAGMDALRVFLDASEAVRAERITEPRGRGHPRTATGDPGP